MNMTQRLTSTTSQSDDAVLPPNQKDISAHLYFRDVTELIPVLAFTTHEK